MLTRQDRLDAYAWAEQDHDLAWTVAVVPTSAVAENSAERVGPHAILNAYREHASVSSGSGAAEPLGELTFAEAHARRNEHLANEAVLHVLATHERCVVIEPNGWIGTEPALAEDVSTDLGHFFSVHWSPSGFQIMEARRGRLIARFDPSLIGTAAGGKDMLPGWVEPEDFPLERLKAAMLVAVEDRAGVACQRDWLTATLPTYRIT